MISGGLDRPKILLDQVQAILQAGPREVAQAAERFAAAPERGIASPISLGVVRVHLVEKPSEFSELIASRIRQRVIARKLA